MVKSVFTLKRVAAAAAGSSSPRAATLPTCPARTVPACPHLGERFYCALCRFQGHRSYFATRQSLNDHHFRRHQVNGVACPECGDKFTRQTLATHRLTCSRAVADLARTLGAVSVTAGSNNPQGGSQPGYRASKICAHSRRGFKARSRSPPRCRPGGGMAVAGSLRTAPVDADMA